MADITISQLSTGTPNKNSAVIPYSDGTTTLKTSPAGIVAASPGCLLQLVQTIKTDYSRIIFTTTPTNVVWNDIPGLSVSITLNSNNRVYIMSSVNGCSTNLSGIRLVRGSTPLGIANSAGTRVVATAGGFWGSGGNTQSVICSNINFLDNPNAGTHTYKIQVCHPQGDVVAINGTANQNDEYYLFRTSSTITAMEIAS